MRSSAWVCACLALCSRCIFWFCCSAVPAAFELVLPLLQWRRLLPSRWMKNIVCLGTGILCVYKRLDVVTLRKFPSSILDSLQTLTLYWYVYELS